MWSKPKSCLLFMLVFILPQLGGRRGKVFRFYGKIYEKQKNCQPVINYMRHLGRHQLWDYSEKALLSVFFHKHRLILISFLAPCIFESWKRQIGFALHPQETTELVSMSAWCPVDADPRWATEAALVLTEPWWVCTPMVGLLG